MSVPNPATTKWVPLGGDARNQMSYWGLYEPSRTYNDGDYAIYNNVLYLCTKNGTTSAPTTWPARVGIVGPPGAQGPQGIGMPLPVMEGQWIKGVSGAATWSPITVADVPNIYAKPTYGTTLPGSPVDGQEYILVDSYYSPTWSWRCRYNAQSTNAQKWEVLSGWPIFSTMMTQLQIGAGVWTSLATGITVPRTGVYIAQGSCRCMQNSAAGVQTYFALSLNAPASYFNPVPGTINSTAGLWSSPLTSPFQISVAAGDQIIPSGYTSAAPAYYDMVVWSITPRRIQ